MKNPSEISAIIQANNLKWTNATVPQRKVMLCEDILDRISTGQYTPVRGIYERILHPCLYQPTGTIPDESLQDIVLAGEVKCQCCARGALFLSHVGFCNKVSLRDALWQVQTGASILSEHNGGLTDVFSQIELRALEVIFEDSGNGNERYVLVKICEYIIKNNGQSLLDISDDISIIHG